MSRKATEKPASKESKAAARREEQAPSEPPPYRLRLPGFVSDEDVGAGDLVRGFTSNYLHIRPCGGCQRRASWLNRRLVITGRRSF